MGSLQAPWMGGLCPAGSREAERERLKFALPASPPRACQRPAQKVYFESDTLRQFFIANSPAPLMGVEIPFGFKGV